MTKFWLKKYVSVMKNTSQSLSWNNILFIDLSEKNWIFILALKHREYWPASQLMFMEQSI